MNHFVLLLYSYGLSTSGITVNLARRPRLFARGTMVTARDLTDEDLDFVFDRGGLSPF